MRGSVFAALGTSADCLELHRPLTPPGTEHALQVYNGLKEKGYEVEIDMDQTGVQQMFRQLVMQEDIESDLTQKFRALQRDGQDGIDKPSFRRLIGGISKIQVATAPETIDHAVNVLWGEVDGERSGTVSLEQILAQVNRLRTQIGSAKKPKK